MNNITKKSNDFNVENNIKLISKFNFDKHIFFEIVMTIIQLFNQPPTCCHNHISPKMFFRTDKINSNILWIFPINIYSNVLIRYIIQRRNEQKAKNLISKGKY